jgi:hypothetical protein
VQNYQNLCANCVAKYVKMPLFNIHEIPSNTMHSGLAITNCFILDVFTPLREDYREKGGINLS